MTLSKYCFLLELEMMTEETIFEWSSFTYLDSEKASYSNKKDTGFKSLQINCWEINQIISKCKMDFFGQNLQKRSKTEKKIVTIEF